ncbi:Spermidine synthase [Corchorus olitorius]|uniref:Spermidine synthase n=1 Tax=Corchorus olitorius TaxID=93759 RepID=A0A1R3G4K2_9ROSI|nr:Spermidine synthase [Corchorus olitorius]
MVKLTQHEIIQYRIPSVDSNLMILVELTYHSPLLHPYALSHGNKCTELLSWLFP